MEKEEQTGTIIGGIALVALLIMGTFSYLMTESGSDTLTGAIAGNGYTYELCLKKYGKDIYGKWNWDEIKKCREVEQAKVKGKDAKVPGSILLYGKPELQE